MPQAKIDKPPYKIPSMQEIADIPWNGFNVVSTFSGCGGSCLGYRMAGYKVLWASEFVPAAQEVYRLNHPDSFLSTQDIRKVYPEQILMETGLEKGGLDLLDGSPPCSSFSNAGKKSEEWGKKSNYSDTSQRTDDLFFEYARILKGLMPKVFVAENVAGLVRGVAKGYFKEILAELKKCGYRVEAKLLDAQWLGAPQTRKRLIFVGVRNDLGIDPVHPSPSNHLYTVRDVLPYVKRINLGGSDWRLSSIPSPTIMASDFPRPETAKFSAGGWIEVQDSTGRKKRKFTIEELKKICAFPDDFQLMGSPFQQWERLGRAVPPIMMRHIAETIRDKVLSCVE